MLVIGCVSCMMLGCVGERDKLLSKLLRFEESVGLSQRDIGSLPAAADARKFIGADPDIECDMQALKHLIAQKGYQSLCESIPETIVKRHAATVKRLYAANETGSAEEATWVVWLYFWEQPLEFKSVHYSGFLRTPTYTVNGFSTHYVLIVGNKVGGASFFTVPATKGRESSKEARDLLTALASSDENTRTNVETRILSGEVYFDTSELALLPQMVNLLKSEDTNVQLAVLTLLGTMGKDAANALPAISECLNSHDKLVRSCVSETIDLIEHPQAGAYENLSNRLLHDYKKPIKALEFKDCLPCKKKYVGHDLVVEKSGGVKWTAE